MSEEYEWDQSGEPSEEVLRLEKTLATLRYDAPFRFPDENAEKKPETKASVRTIPLAPIAMAALVLIGVGALLWQRAGTTTTEERAKVSALDSEECDFGSKAGAPWTVNVLQGEARCGSKSLQGASSGSGASLSLGSVIETGDGARARVLVADIGTLEMSPQSVLSLKGSSKQEHRMKLHRGKIHAWVDAPPRLFVVETPKVVAVDLGCEYELEVLETGETLLSVLSGFVALENGVLDKQGVSIFVPAGYTSLTTADGKVAMPLSNGASQELRNAARALAESPESPEALHALWDASQSPADTLGIWHLSQWPGVSCLELNEKLRTLSAINPDPLGLGWGECSDPTWKQSWQNALEPVWGMVLEN